MVLPDKYRFFIHFSVCCAWAFLVMLTGSACHTDHTASAVERAREYALDNLRGITANQREFIRFTQPEIYEDVVFPRYVTPLLPTGHNKMENSSHFPTAPHQDLMHSCVVWSPPDMTGKIIVVGDGERNMLFWRPYRVMVKRFLPPDIAGGAISACRKYAQDWMLFLPNKTRDRIRFSDPVEICFTKLDIPEPIREKPQNLESEWLQYLNEQGRSNQQISQISLIWPADDEEHCVVFSGYTNNGSVSAWKISTAELMRKEKLNQHRLTKEEEALIKVAPPPEDKLFFKEEKEIERIKGNVTPDTPKNSKNVQYK